MTAFIKAYKYWLVGSIVGAIGGYIYYVNWGCLNGCPLQSVWYTMTGYGALLGAFIFSSIEDFTKKKE